MLANWVERDPASIQDGQIDEQQGGGEGPPALDEQGSGDLGGLPAHPEPDPDESPGGEEGGGVSAQKELFEAGPMTRSKTKQMGKQ